jgi:hypothetical protein
MSIQERTPKREWATEQVTKPAAEMTDQEWSAHLDDIDAARAARSERPLRRGLLQKPEPVSEATRAYARGMSLPDA